MNRSWVIAVVAAGGLGAVAACGRPPDTAPADLVMEVFERQAQEEQLTRVETDGKRLFGRYCATCHGETGAGDGQNAFNLDPVPPDFREVLSDKGETYWRQVIEGGTAAVGRSPLCPPWGRTLEPAEIDAVIAYLHVLARPGPAGSGGTDPPVRPPVEPGAS